MRDNQFFNRQVEGYVRHSDLVGHAARNQAVYLAAMSGKPYVEALAFADKTLRAKMVDPEIKFLGKNSKGDRVKKTATFSQHINDAYEKDRILVGNLHVNENPKVLTSLTADFIIEKSKERKVEKEAEKAAQMAGDKEKEELHASRQTTIKRFLNSISGAHASPHNPLYNNTAHTSLTVTTRIPTSISNALAERCLGGSRVYFTAQTAIDDLCASIALADQSKVEYAMQTLSLTYPTAEQLEEHVMYSFKLYSRNENDMKKISTFIHKLKPWQLAVGMFTYDLVGLWKVNPDWTLGLIRSLSTPAEDKIEDWKPWVDGVDGYMGDQIAMVMAGSLKGRARKDVMKEEPEVMMQWAATIRKNEEHLTSVRPWIEAFFLTDHNIISVWDVPKMQRRIVPLSDTDSTFFICEDWVERVFGKLRFDNEGMAVSATMMFLDVACLKHLLALFSKQMGVADEHLFRIAMKSEFFMSVIGVTNIAKHYYSSVLAREGEVYPKPDLDTKGVNLKSSRISKTLIKSSDKFMEFIVECVTTGRKLHPEELLRLPCSWAHEVRDSVRNAEAYYLPSAKVKSVHAYKAPETSVALRQHDFWVKVFGQDYGVVEPPYEAVSVPVNLDKPAKLQEWIQTLPPAMGARAQRWLDDKQVKGLSNVFVPRMLIREDKYPKELAHVADLVKSERTALRSMIMTLETTGIYTDSPKDTKLLSTLYPKSSMALLDRDTLWSLEYDL